MILAVTAERLVVVSDLHFGSPASRADRFFGAFLDEVAGSGRALCINGDGFDLLQSTPARLAVSGFPMLQRLQRLAADGLPIYYVLGNHDLALEHVLFDLPFVVSPFLNVVSGDRRIRIEHGHVHDPVYARLPGLYEFGARVGGLALLARSDIYSLHSRAQSAWTIGAAVQDGRALTRTMPRRSIYSIVDSMPQCSATPISLSWSSSTVAPSPTAATGSATEHASPSTMGALLSTNGSRASCARRRRNRGLRRRLSGNVSSASQAVITRK